MQQGKPRFLGIPAFSRPSYHIEATSKKTLPSFSLKIAKEAREEAHVIRRDIRCIRTTTAAILQDTGKKSCRPLCLSLVSFAQDQLSNWPAFREEAVG